MQNTSVTRPILKAMRVKEGSAFLGIAESTFWRGVKEGRFAPHFGLGKTRKGRNL